MAKDTIHLEGEWWYGRREYGGGLVGSVLGLPVTFRLCFNGTLVAEGEPHMEARKAKLACNKAAEAFIRAARRLVEDYPES